MLGRCLAMSAGALLLAGFLLVLGVPGAVFLGLAPALVCVSMHLVMGHGAPGHTGTDVHNLADPASRDPNRS